MNLREFANIIKRLPADWHNLDWVEVKFARYGTILAAAHPEKELMIYDDEDGKWGKARRQENDQ